MQSLADRAGRIALAARRHRLVAEIDRALRRRCGVTAGSPILLGVSGGADSVALLLAMIILRDRRSARHAPLQPVAAHVHHHLRGESADHDAAFVAELCRIHGVEHHRAEVHPGDLTGNLADNARRLRYDALARIARDVGAPHVAVAHHADDQFETMLMALCRGAGLDGLTAMTWTRPLADGVALVRPMLGLRRSACEGFLLAAGAPWREDPSNHDPTSRRTRVRRDVIPVLESLWPDAAGRAASTIATLAAAEQALNELVERSFGEPARRQWRRDELAKLPTAVIAAGLRRAALDASPERADSLSARILLPAAEAIASDESAPRRFDWPAGLALSVTARDVRLQG